MFEKTLNDLIRGLRANKANERRYISSAIVECKQEAKSQDLDVKADAILKVAYLAMFGQDMAWASFNIIEVMSSTRFRHKQIGYLAASIGFRQDTDVLMLSTNLIKKDVSSSNIAEVSVAIRGLADIVSPDLARDLSQDLAIMLNHSKPTIRKKAVLVMYKVFLQYPEALRSAYPKLREKLEDPDSSTVNVICELSRKTPKNYLPLAPILFEFLTTSSNNWMLIKIIKLFATLTPMEPRLIKKLVPPLTHLIQTTPAMSLLYECINTVISGEMLKSPDSESLAKLCISKLRTFFENTDQNLKYVGLLALTKVVESHPDMVASHQDVILQCIDDPDISIRLRALELVTFLPTRKVLPEIVKRLIIQLLPSSETELPSSYRKHLVLRLISMSSNESYQYVENFEWYFAVLMDLVKIAKVDVGQQLNEEIRNVCVRVKAVRSFAVPILAKLMCDRELLENAADESRNVRVLHTAAWAAGEYLDDPLQALNDLCAAPFLNLDDDTQSIYLQALPKLYCRWTQSIVDFDIEVKSTMALQNQRISRLLSPFTRSTDVEVQRRATELAQLFAIADQCLDASEADLGMPLFFVDILPNLFLKGGSLNPVAPAAQRLIPIPEGLDLAESIRPQSPLSYPDLDIVGQEATASIQLLDDAADDLSRYQDARLERMKDDPYYIFSNPSGHPMDSSQIAHDETLTPVTELMIMGSQARRKKRKKIFGQVPSEPITVIADEMPNNIGISGIQQGSTSKNLAKDVSAQLNVLKVDSSRLSSLSLEDEAPTVIEDRSVAQSKQHRISKSTKQGRSHEKSANVKQELRPLKTSQNIRLLETDVIPVKKKRSKRREIDLFND